MSEEDRPGPTQSHTYMALDDRAEPGSRHPQFVDLSGRPPGKVGQNQIPTVVNTAHRSKIRPIVRSPI